MLQECRIALALFLLAAVVPLLWAGIDARRRQSLKRTAYSLCASRTRHLERCMHLHPGELAEGSYEACRSGGNSHADCREFGPPPRRTR